VIILVGSTRPAKVEGAREALAAIAGIDSRFTHVSIESHDLTAISPPQPMSVAEIIDGARTRARVLSDKYPGTIAVGAEGGLDEILPDVWSLQSWAAVTDGSRWGYGAGPALVLPTGLVDRVRAGEELGDVIDRLAAEDVRGTRGAWGVLTRDLIGRREAFRLAVLAAFAPFYNARAWGG
jgi:inosine/xanthosine triphosphatase